MAEEFLVLVEDLLRPINNASKSWDIDVASVLQYFLDCTEKGLINLENANIKNNENDKKQNDFNICRESELEKDKENREIRGIDSSDSYTMEFTQAAIIVEKSAILLSQKIEHLYHLAYSALKNINSNEKFAQDEDKGAGENRLKSVNTKPADYFEENEDIPAVFLLPNFPIGRKIEMEDEEIEREEKKFDEEQKENVKIDEETEERLVLGSGNYLRLPSILFKQGEKEKSQNTSGYMGDLTEHTNLHLLSYDLSYRHTILFDKLDFRFLSIKKMKKDENKKQNNFTLNNERNSSPQKLKTISDPNEGMNENGANSDLKKNSELIVKEKESEKKKKKIFLGMNKIVGIYEIKDEKEYQYFFSDNFEDKLGKDNNWSFMDEDKCFGIDKSIKSEHKKTTIPLPCYSLSCREIDDPTLFFRCVLNLESIIKNDCAEENVSFKRKNIDMKEEIGNKRKKNNNYVPYFNDLKIPTLNCEKLGLKKGDFVFFEHLLARTMKKKNEKTQKLKKKCLNGEFDFERIENIRKTRSVIESDENNELNDQMEENVMDNCSQLDFNNFYNVYNLEFALERAKDFYETAFNNHINEMDKYESAFNSEMASDEMDLHLRVRRWSEFLEAELEKLSLLPAFDINRYKKHLLKKVLVKIKKKKEAIFSEIVEGQPKYEVCRTFLAALMLTNLQQLDICTKKGEEIDDERDSFVVKLLTNEDAIESIPEDNLIDLSSLVNKNKFPNKSSNSCRNTTPKRLKIDIFDNENVTLSLKKPIIFKKKTENGYLINDSENESEVNHDYKDEIK